MLKQEGFAFMGAAFEVYNQLGYGMAEEIYQQSLEIELETRSIPFRTTHDLAVFYKDRQLATKYKPDLIVWDGIVVELKAVAQLLPEHEAQLFNYLRIARRPSGYLVNFGRKGELEWKRFILTDLHSAVLNQGAPKHDRSAAGDRTNTKCCLEPCRRSLSQWLPADASDMLASGPGDVRQPTTSHEKGSACKWHDKIDCWRPLPSPW
ncbi:MAG TPA: GxxExxY protein [Pirellulales bacterium]|nr:GxxExxY protein [Pirellulales bacterium]